ncbi:MAG: hypothetical protein H0X39_06425 [Actinobacteria bacterium]|nr:hypothetical protein [Actinomycetota bacterium]
MERTELRVLGPLEVDREARLVDVGAPKQRALLLELLLARGRFVPRTG